MDKFAPNIRYQFVCAGLYVYKCYSLSQTDVRLSFLQTVILTSSTLHGMGGPDIFLDRLEINITIGVFRQLLLICDISSVRACLSCVRACDEGRWGSFWLLRWRAQV